MHYLTFSKSAEIMAQFPDDTALVDSDFQYFISAADASDMPSGITLHRRRRSVTGPRRGIANPAATMWFTLTGSISKRSKC